MNSIFKKLAELETRHEDGVLCTIIRSSGSTPRHAGSKLLIFPDGRFIGTVGGGEVESRVIHEALEALKDGHPRLVSYDMVDPQQGDPGVCGGQVEIYVEPILSQAEILIIGGGHVGKAVAHLGKWLNFRIIISDDREEFCTPEENPDADEFLPVKMDAITGSYKIRPQTYIVLTTRGTNVDVEGLPSLLESPAGYIGVIGSKRRWAITRKSLEESGLSLDVLNRVHSPIGLELNAETPEEIAVSIMAEIIMVRNGGSGQPMGMVL